MDEVLRQILRKLMSLPGSYSGECPCGADLSSNSWDKDDKAASDILRMHP